MRAAQ